MTNILNRSPLETEAKDLSIYVSIARLRHAPNNVLIIPITEINNEWRVLALDWVVDH